MKQIIDNYNEFLIWLNQEHGVDDSDYKRVLKTNHLV